VQIVGFSAYTCLLSRELLIDPLFDEGAAEELAGNPRILFEPGVYQLTGIVTQQPLSLLICARMGQ
jgi:hypothetical protein